MFIIHPTLAVSYRDVILYLTANKVIIVVLKIVYLREFFKEAYSQISLQDSKNMYDWYAFFLGVAYTFTDQQRFSLF